MSKSIYFSITLVAVFLGFIMAFQFRTTSAVDKGVPFNREQELVMEKKQLEKDLSQLREEVADLSGKLDEAGKGNPIFALESELAKLKLYAGLVPVTGPGVEITLDSYEHARAIPTPVHDDDLLKVVNDLRGAGAEALAINDQRIVATSEIRLAGSHINVNMVRLSPPYRITAIGNAATLKSSMEIRGGLVEYLSDRGISVSVKEQYNILIPAFSRALNFEHAKPVQRR